jgi:hypothetical protein
MPAISHQIGGSLLSSITLTPTQRGSAGAVPD